MTVHDIFAEKNIIHIGKSKKNLSLKTIYTVYNVVKTQNKRIQCIYYYRVKKQKML